MKEQLRGNSDMPSMRCDGWCSRWLLVLIIMGIFSQPYALMAREVTIESLDSEAGADSYHDTSGLDMVESVQVKGNERIEEDAILAVVRTKAGDLLDYDILDKDLRDIYRMGYFKDVRVEAENGEKGKKIIFVVTEKPIIGKIEFTGNDNLKESKLKEELGIELYAILDLNEIKQSINRLKDLYHKKGYYNVVITYKIHGLPNNEVLLKYEIQENKKVYITKIEILGNKAFDDGDIKKIMLTGEKTLFSWITDSGYLDMKKLEFDTHRITAFYHNHGFINAKVGEPEVFYDKEKGLTIKIYIDEGVQYGINKVEIGGDIIKPADELLKVVKIGKEKVFNREIIRNDIDALKEVCADEGYAYADVSPEIRRDDKARLVDVTYVISKGYKVTVERINIIGNTITRDKVIRRELKLIEGEYFSGKDLNRSTENLNRLGFFEDVKIEKRRGTSEDKMALDVKVKEGRTGSFSFGAGFSSVDSLVATVQISEENFRGYGQRLASQLRIGSISNQFDISFAEPWLFDRPVSGTFRLFKWEREYDDYTKDSKGVNISIGFPLKKFDDYTFGWSFYRYDDAEISDIDYDVAYEIRAMEGRYVTSSIGFGIRRNSTNRARNPNKGSINSFSFEYAGLGGDNEYNKYLAQSCWFFALPKDAVFKVQGRWGYLQERGGKIIPVYERFFLGGIDTVRGFDYQEISPRDPVTGDEIGGEKMMVYNFEYIFPVSKDQSILGLFFIDAGDVRAKGESWTFSGMRKSAGLGVRWQSPMGPIRIEWGYNLDKQEGDRSSKLEFSMGTTF